LIRNLISRIWDMRLFLGLCLLASTSVAAAQTASPSPTPGPPSSEIWIADLTGKHGVFTVGRPKKITDHAGYNNQPFFLPNGKSVLYTSIREKQPDIYRYDIGGATTQITNTPEGEYSPTVLPDGKHMSVVRVESDGTQRLWKFPLGGGPPSVILESIKPVGYHWWIDKDTLALFILGAEGKPHTLQIADVRTGKSEVIADNPGRILRRIPAQDKLSFVHKISDQDWIIKAFDLRTREQSILIKTLPASEDYAWTPDGVLFMAKDSKLFKWEPSKDKVWQEVRDFSQDRFTRITRIAISPKGDRIAMVTLSGNPR
jgi:hypothetical protein